VFSAGLNRKACPVAPKGEARDFGYPLIIQALLLYYGFNPNNSFNAFSNKIMSFDEKLPSFLIISFDSIVDTADLSNDGFKRPVFSQSSITYSVGPLTLCVLLVIAMMIISDESLLYLSELIITAGRFFDVIWSLKGKGTRTTLPLL
jgi:hypothetical protein